MQENADIAEKLNNHRLPVDESYWAEMEKRLQNDRKRLVPLWMWLAEMGVAASLALWLAVPFLNTDPEGTGTQITQIGQVFSDSAVVEGQTAQDSADKGGLVGSSPALRPLRALSALMPVETVEQPTQDTTTKKQYELKNPYEEVFIAQNEFPKRKSQKKKSWQIAAAFGSNNSGFSTNDLAYSNRPSGNSSDKFFVAPESGGVRSALPSIDEIFHPFPEVTHLPPLSVGLTVRKNFNRHWAIETGFTYSFLQSKFEESNEWTRRSATLKLHYIGIPLNAVVYLLNKPKWNVYCSLGGMVEKGLMLDFVQHTTSYYRENSPVHTVSLQDHIPELQWSMNASVGLGYKLYRDISIYMEPRVLYYFKNNQPVSMRTDMPLLMGLNAGLRFAF